jgi:hypothetical protein
MESIKAEMAAWAGVQNTILEVLEGHTDLLGKINRAVQRQESGESGGAQTGGGPARRHR